MVGFAAVRNSIAASSIDLGIAFRLETLALCCTLDLRRLLAVNLSQVRGRCLVTSRWVVPAVPLERHPLSKSMQQIASVLVTGLVAFVTVLAVIFLFVALTVERVACCCPVRSGSISTGKIGRVLDAG